MADVITIDQRVEKVMDMLLLGKISEEFAIEAINNLREAERQRIAQPSVQQSPQPSVLEQMGQQMQSSAQAQIQNARSFMHPQQVQSQVAPVQPQQPAPQTQQTGTPVQPQQPTPQTQQTGTPVQPQQPAPQAQQQGAPAQPQQAAPQAQQQGAPAQPQPAPPTQQQGTPAQPQSTTGPQANAQALNNINPANARVDALKQLEPGQLIIKRRKIAKKESNLKLIHNALIIGKSTLYVIITIIGAYAISLINGAGLAAISVAAAGIGSLIAMQTTATNTKNTKWNFLNKFQDWMKDASRKKDIDMYSQYRKEIKDEIDSRGPAR